jgi:hypothetical protein
MGGTHVAFVYIFRSGDQNIFKIGHTRNEPNKRRKHLSTGNPHQLTIFDTIKTEPNQHTLCETFLHKILRSKKFIDGDAREFFCVDVSELEGAIRQARKFLEEFLPKQKAVDDLSKRKSDGRLVTPGEAEKDIYRRLIRIREEQDKLELERTILENDLKLALGTASELAGLVTWKTSFKQDFQTTKFKIDHPALYEAYLRQLQIRTFRLR